MGSWTGQTKTGFLNGRLVEVLRFSPSHSFGVNESQGVGVKPLRSAGLVALALKSLWVVGSDPGQA